MSAPAGVKDVLLGPGELWFGGAAHRVRTLLGSCVAVVLWHPYHRLGGMCHYLLPSRGAPGHTRLELDARYADEAMLLFRRKLLRTGTRPSEYLARLYGAGRMFARGEDAATDCTTVGCRNAEAGQRLLDEHGFTLVADELGGNVHRTITFEVWSGEIQVRRSSMGTAGVPAPAVPATEEKPP